jgi:hypothetical protein
VPIPGSRKLERLDENLGAAAIQLTASNLDEIKIAMSQITVVGDRYSCTGGYAGASPLTRVDLVRRLSDGTLDKH